MQGILNNTKNVKRSKVVPVPSDAYRSTSPPIIDPDGVDIKVEMESASDSGPDIEEIAVLEQ